MNKITWRYVMVITLVVGAVSLSLLFRDSLFHKVGDEVDSFNGVPVYYNGSFGNVTGRNLTEENYNLGLKYQCVEFVKRYYYQHLDHKMPNSYGHAKDYFDKSLSNGEYNRERNLVQFSNPSKSKPKEGDIIVFGATALNSFGHIAIIARVKDKEIEIIQQNTRNTREKLTLKTTGGTCDIMDKTVLGRLRTGH